MFAPELGQPHALQRVFHAAEAVESEHVSGRRKRRKHRVIIRAPPIDADHHGRNVEHRLGHHGIADAPEYSPFPRDEFSEIFLGEGQIRHVLPRGLDLRGHDVRIGRGRHVPACPVGLERILT